MRKNMKLIVSAFAAVVLSNGAAFAGGTTVPTFSWDGGYGGVQAGYVWGKSQYSEPGYSQPGTINYDPKGAMGGLYGGYNWQLGSNLALGVEIDLSGSNVDGDSPYIDSTGHPFPGASGQADLRWSGALRGRLGYAADRFLPYLAGGIALGSYEYGAGVHHNGQYDAFTMSNVRIGWTVGAGMEYAFTNKLSGRFEYRYTDFGDKTLDVNETGNWAVGNKVDLKTSEIRVGIAYKF